MLCGRTHDVLCDVCHQQANDDQHHTNGSPHRCHGNDNVLHPRWRQGELHTVLPVYFLRWAGTGQGAQADAVGDLLVQLGQQEVSAAGAEEHAGTLELSVTSVPPAAQLIAVASLAVLTSSLPSQVLLSCRICPGTSAVRPRSCGILSGCVLLLTLLPLEQHAAIDEYVRRQVLHSQHCPAVTLMTLVATQGVPKTQLPPDSSLHHSVGTQR